ncbi:MAG: hypothetical protein HY291_23690 [Planctomycetes bacterium]|nr:hypothetical protein [Planctomycetota bacterium]
MNMRSGFLVLAGVATGAVWIAMMVQAGPVCAAEPAHPGNDKAPMGSADFYPSPAHPIGWRGDGTGCYPGANPPTVWYQKANGESKNILWKVKLPSYSWSTPIVIGDKIVTRSEPYDLICLNKNTGKLLWIRAHPPFLGVSDEEKKANPAFKEVEPLVAELQKVNDAFVAQGWTAALFKQKHDLQIKIDELSGKADKKYKLPPDMYVESWAGYTASTPCSDGAHIFIISGDGIAACYDLEGKLSWSRYELLTPIWGEHGFASSPALAGDVFLAPSIRVRGLNKATGEEIYKEPFGCAYSIVTFPSNGVDFAVSAGNYFRVKDGKVIIPCVGDMPRGQMVVNGNMIYFSAAHVSYNKWEPKGGDEIAVTPLIPEVYNRIGLPGGDSPSLKVDQTITGFRTASPLYHDGLLYNLSNFGNLAVMDTQKVKAQDGLVYTTFPPFDFKNPYSRKTFGMGIGASPALAGKYIYMIDSANCTIVMEPGRAYKEVSKNAIEESVPEPSSNASGSKPYWMGPHQEQTEASPIFDGNRIYIRGEQYLYCIGEK